MRINKITGESCKTTRSLWEEVFYEDSVQFTDYYFQNKVEKNIGYVIGQAPYDAMMFRTPYPLQVGKEQREISYIVGVATRKEYRHRGYMRKLLMHSLEEMYREKEPFAFLMPANPAIYEPFDFRYVYERDMWKLKEGIVLEEYVKSEEVTGQQEAESKIICVKTDLGKLNTADELLSGEELKAAEFQGNDNIINGLYSVNSLQRQFPDFPILFMLAEFANEYLKEHFNIYVHRDEAYYEIQMKELAAQNGDIYVLFEQSKIKAFFLYAKEGDEVFIQEVMETEEGILNFLQKEEKKKPIIMARIIHLEEMLKLVCSNESKTVIIKVEDPLVLENTGTFKMEMMSEGSKVMRIHLKENEQEEIPKISMHISDVVTWGLNKVFINEIV